MRGPAYAILLTPLFLSCDSARPTESPSQVALRPELATSGDLSDAALLVGNFIPMTPGNSILRYDASGQFIDVFVNLGLPNGPRGGCCMTFGPDENLYVTQTGGAVMPGRVNRFNGVTGEFIDEFISPGVGGLMRPLAIALGPDGNLYVGDIGSHSIRRYNGRTGESIDDFVVGLGANDPQLFVFGPDANLYVGVPGLNAVRRFDPVTKEIEDFVTGTVDQPLRGGVTFGPDGNLYVGVANGVNRYDGRTGAFIDAFVPQGSGGLSVPVGLTFGPDGNFYVASPGSVGDGSVLRYDGTTGAFIDAFVPATEPHITGPRVLEFKSKITMCHRPPGNPDRQTSISIGYLSAGNHVAHGDAVGSCQ
jgi:hypothetical protein